MKITRARVALASALAIGTVLLAGTAPAYANQQVSFYVTSATGGTRYWLVPNSIGQVIISTPIIPAQWSNINGTTWINNRPVYEWQNTNGTGLCLTWEGAGIQTRVTPCQKGNTTQLWWQNNNHLINVKATNQSTTNQCLNAEHLQIGSPVNVIGCKSKSQPGWWDQVWYSIPHP